MAMIDRTALTTATPIVASLVVMATLAWPSRKSLELSGRFRTIEFTCTHYAAPRAYYRDGQQRQVVRGLQVVTRFRDPAELDSFAVNYTPTLFIGEHAADSGIAISRDTMQWEFYDVDALAIGDRLGYGYRNLADAVGATSPSDVSYAATTRSRYASSVVFHAGRSMQRAW